LPLKALTLSQRLAASGQRPRDPRPSAAARGYNAAWRLLRHRHLSANPMCTECVRQGRPRLAVLADHTKPISSGGPALDPLNLRSLCREHHDIITANYRRTGINELP